jgi:hypothetical protein
MVGTTERDMSFASLTTSRSGLASLVQSRVGGMDAAHPDAIAAALRTRTITVRLTATEYAAWAAATARSPWTSIAHWARSVIVDALDRDDRSVAVGVLPDVDAVAVESVTSWCGRLNLLARDSNRLGRAVPEVVEAVEAVAQWAAHVSSGCRPPVASLPAVGVEDAGVTERSTERRVKAVPIRVSDDEMDRLKAATERDGWVRVMPWARAVVCRLAGVPVALPRPVIPSRLHEVRRQLAGAMSLMGQVSAVMVESRDPALERVERAHLELAEALAVFSRVGL